MLSDSAIVKKIERQPRQTAGFKQLVRELGLRGEARAELSRQLERLVASGLLRRVDSDRYALPRAASGKNMVVGRLSMHRDGFGFVIPDAGSLDERLKARLSGDIFIPPPFVGSAMHGDRVLVELGTIRPDGRAEGLIVRPVGRAHSTVVGTFHYGRPSQLRHSQRSKSDARDRDPDRHGDSLDLPGRQIRHPTIRPRGRSRGKMSIGFSGDQAARAAKGDDLEGVVVDVEITDWPTATQNPRGRVVEILGYPDDFGVDVEIMIRKFHLPHQFPAEVLREAQAVEADQHRERNPQTARLPRFADCDH